MKKIFTLAFSSIFSLAVFAFDGSRLSISAPGTSTELKIEIDGRTFTMQNNAITLSYLAEGYHQVKIFHEVTKGNRGRLKREDVIYSSTICLKNGIHVDITVNRFGKTLVDEHPIDRKDDWYNKEEDYYDSDNAGWNNGNSNVMRSSDFDRLKETLRKEWFENNRVTSVKTVTDKFNFTTKQVKDLMLLFTFESNRLEIAKYAFRKTVDKENYFQLNDVLTFSSSKDDLARFIRESR